MDAITVGSNLAWEATARCIVATSPGVQANTRAARCFYNSPMKSTLPSDLHQLLGGLSPQQFMRGWWHKKPLLIRNAIPGFKPLISKAQLFTLAKQDEVESRIVSQNGRIWQLDHGPVEARDLRRNPGEKWTLLVQGVNLHLSAADALLRRFCFVPYARIDDLMVSYAIDGGGVGPHFDSYDVFLLQAQGTRRWRISQQADRTLVEGAPLKVLKHFKPTAEYLLEPGDMLYLPPGCAHDGVAIGECMTYSIGFRAPSAQELATGLLEHAAEQVVRKGFYADSSLQPTASPALLSDAYVRQAARLIGNVRPSRAMLEAFLGCKLTEPKSNVFFDPPQRPMSAALFARALHKQGASLDRRTQMLYRGKALFINGETADTAASPLLQSLANARVLAPGVRLSAADANALHIWYTYGWVHPGERL
jgi:50S ribosomal protein L16 3-hydroxylase